MSTWRKVGCCLIAAIAAFGAWAETPTAADYTRDGLVAQWDGIDNAGTGTHNSSAATWADRIGGRTVTRVDTSGGGSWGENCFVEGSSDTSAFWVEDNTLKNAIASGSVTVEIFCEHSTSTASGKYEDWLGFGKDGSSRWLKLDIRTGDVNPSTKVFQGLQYRTTTWNNSAKVPDNTVFDWGVPQYAAIVCEGTTATLYGNGSNKVHSVSYGTTTPTDGVFTFGGFSKGVSSSPSINAKIYAVRIYDRALTAKEMAYNYAVDQFRFCNNPEPYSEFVSFRVQPIPGQAFTGAAIVPDVQVSFIGTDPATPLTKDRDYTVTCENNVAIGTARMTITGINSYEDKIPLETTFEIVAPSDEGLELAGDFSRKAIVAGWGVIVPGLALKDADGQPLAADSYETGLLNADKTGMATVWARVTSGVHEGAVVARTLPVAVVPAEYMPVAWIGATGEQWVDTGVVPVKARTGVDIRFGQVKNAGNQALFAQSWVWGNGFLFQMNPSFVFDNNKALAGYAAGRDYHVTIAPGGTVTMDYGAGEATYTGYNNGTQANTTLGLFAPNGGGNYRSTCRIYSFSMTDDGVTVCDFIPVRRVSDGEPGFYDVAAADPATAFHGNKRTTGAKLQCGADLIGFRLEEIPIQSYDPNRACEPKPQIVDAKTGEVLDAAGFDFAYANNRAVGFATVTVTGKAGTAYAGRTVSATFPIARRYYVKAVVETEGDGSGWGNELSLSNALTMAASATEPCEFWLAADEPILSPYAVSLTAPLWIRGGFAGDEATPEDRAEGALTTFDGKATVTCILTVDNAENAGLTLERIKICHAKANGLIKTGSGGLALYDCEISGNGLWTNTIYGRGMKVSGGGVGTLVVSNCVYAGNRHPDGSDNTYGGFAIYASAFKSATIDNTLFVTNGFNLNSPGASGWCGYCSRGAAIDMIDTPTTARFCRFAGNCCPIRTSNVNGNWGGGTVFLQGNSGGSLFDHCQFVGNTDRLSYQANDVAYSGALAIYLSSKLDKVSVRSCTFAYNITQGQQSGGGLTVGQGDVDIENSIFWRNERAHVTTLGYGKDIQVHANGTAHIAHSYVSTLDGTALVGAGLTIDPETVIAADPLLVTTTDEFEGLCTINASRFYYNTSSLEAMADMDCHLLSSAGYFLNDGSVGPVTEDYSPAIDSGNPESDYSRELPPNGSCINLGAFGNTPEASKTSVGVPTADVTVTYPDGMARPKVRIEMGLAEGTPYSATMTLTCTTNGVILYEKSYVGVKMTDVFEERLPYYLPVGTVVTASVTMKTRGAADQTSSASGTAEGTVPAFFGKGGGRHVIHVRQGADCLMDGSSWTDAYPDLTTAFKSAPDADKMEVWLSVTNDYLPTTVTLSYPLTIRGGFAGVENSETDRVAGVMSVLSANNLFKNLELNNAAGTLLTIERIWATKSAGSGIKKGGAGDLIVRDCRFEGLDWSGKANGRGIYAAGGNVAVTNCVFANNVGPNEDGGNGYGIYFSACAYAAVDNCLFVSNGYNFASAGSTFYSKIRGVGIFADATPTEIRNCRFAANCTPQREANDGGVIYFNGACGGSSMMNCALVGNGEIYSFQSGNASGHNGALVVNMSKATDTLDVKNCTIAYNLAQGASAPAGVHVRQGEVNIADSIIFGNVRGNKSLTGFGADVHVAGGACFMRYCTVTALDDTSLSGNGLSLDPDGTVRAADPCFVTSRADYLSWLDDTASWINCKAANRAKHAAIDVHLLSSAGYCRNDGEPGPETDVYSPCIDTGDSLEDCSLEPDPNGGILNQGAYGNTPEASKSSVGQPKIAAGEVTFPDGQSRPHFILQLGIASGTDFSATVHLTCTTGGVTMAETSYAGQSKTSAIDWTLPFFAVPGDEVSVKVVVTAKEAEDVVQTFTRVAEGGQPEYYGKGGGAHVLHIRAGADCRMNGSDWTDAYPTLQAALAGGIPADKTEVWIAVSNDCFTSTLEITNAVKFLGGFTGTENAASERPDGTYAKLDGQLVYKTLAVDVADGALLEVDRVIFTRSTSCALKKTGAGDLVIRDCQFVNNQAGGRIDGRGLYVSGGHATVSNCQFRLNRGGTELPGFGCGIHLTDCVNAFVDDCLFATNGGRFGTCQETWSGQYNGSAAYVNNTPAVFRNCRFTAHGSGQRTTADGGTIYFCGNSGGSALTNCTLVGNSDFLSNQYSATGRAGGALVCALSSPSATLDVCNCTIAYNLTQGQYSSAGINVMSGTVNVRNSIVFGNVRGRRTSQDAGADIDVKEGATANLDYTLLTATNMPSVGASGTLNLAPTCFAADPLLVSATNDFQSLLSGDANWWNLASGKEGACAALNVHLRGAGGYFDERTGEKVRAFKGPPDSPAIDAGDPRSDYSRERKPNSHRINLGAYGNTPWATMSKNGLLIFVK